MRKPGRRFPVPEESPGMSFDRRSPVLRPTASRLLRAESDVMKAFHVPEGFLPTGLDNCRCTFPCGVLHAHCEHRVPQPPPRNEESAVAASEPYTPGAIVQTADSMHAVYSARVSRSRTPCVIAHKQLLFSIDFCMACREREPATSGSFRWSTVCPGPLSLRGRPHAAGEGTCPQTPGRTSGLNPNKTRQQAVSPP